FKTNYRGVGYCSDAHRARALREVGIEWNPHKTAEERWGGEPPLVIPPEAHKMLLKFAEIILAQQEKVEVLPEVPTDSGVSIAVTEPILPQDTIDFFEIPEQESR